jgi:hypothetical protein
VPPKQIDNWWLTSFAQRPVKSSWGRLVKHACYYWLMRAGSMVRRIAG